MQFIHIPKVSKEFVDTLNTVFRKRIITPTTDINDIMYNAGQRSVIEYIINVHNDNINSPDDMRGKIG